LEHEQELLVIINEKLRGLQPDAAAALTRMNETAWEAADPGLLELCRCLIVSMLDAGAPRRAANPAAPAPTADQIAALGAWRDSDLFSPLERAALEFTEQFVVSVSSVTDEQVEALRSRLGDEKTYAFAAALYVIEMSERLCIVSAAVLGNGGEH
jgi:hypothetical protein